MVDFDIITVSTVTYMLWVIVFAHELLFSLAKNQCYYVIIDHKIELYLTFKLKLGYSNVGVLLLYVCRLFIRVYVYGLIFLN